MRVEYMNVNTNKLHDELINAGIVPLLVESKDDITWITFAYDVDLQVVQVVIDAHNPEPPPRELTGVERLQQLETLVVNNISQQIENQIMKGEYHGIN